MPRKSQLKITKRTVESLRVDGTDAVFWDRELSGFGVRVHGTGRKVYVAQTRGPGGTRRVSIGRHGVVCSNKARRLAAAIIDRIKCGEDPLPRVPEPELTVAELAKRYWRAHVEVNCKDSTAELYRGVIENHILPAPGERLIGSIGRKDVIELHHRLRDKRSMANRTVLILSKMFSLAEAWGLVPAGRNPCRSVRPYTIRARERFLKPDEFRRLGQALREVETDGTIWPPAIAARDCRISDTTGDACRPERT